MRLDGKTHREIARACGVSPQYVAKLIKVHEQNRKISPEWDYGLSTRVLNCLKRNFIPLDPYVIADSLDLLLLMRGVGKRTLDEIGNMLKDLNIIDNIDEWIAEGKRKQYNQYHNVFGTLSYDRSREYVRHIAT